MFTSLEKDLSQATSAVVTAVDYLWFDFDLFWSSGLCCCGYICLYFCVTASVAELTDEVEQLQKAQKLHQETVRHYETELAVF